MPSRNIRGGKAFKKGKKGGGNTEGEGKQKFQGLQPGQDYARVLRVLGNGRMLCFCNDGSDRVCKIRGRLRKGTHRQHIEEKDIVIISVRDFSTPDSDSEDSEDAKPKITRTGQENLSDMTVTASAKRLENGNREIADIEAKIPISQWKYVRKEPNIHKMLFLADSTGGEGEGDDDLFDREEEGVIRHVDESDSVDIDAI
jgi:initiation factor 1A